MKEQFDRRVRLAQDRTHLANERTLLAYWRTALAFLALGLFIVRFLASTNFTILGLLVIMLGFTLFIYGIIKYFKHRKIIKNI